MLYAFPFACLAKHYFSLYLYAQITLLMQKKIWLSFIIICCCFLSVCSQTVRNRNEIRVAFWNLENFMDPRNDSITNDDDYTPEGSKHWGASKFEKKKQNIYKAIMALGEWDAPEIVGLCEVENAYVVKQLIFDTPLKRFNYSFIHFDSPDRRGIDVALIYRPDKFRPLEYFPIPVVYDFDKDSKTRDILYVKGIFAQDTLHLFVCHFPSKFGGAIETEPKRCYVGNLLRNITDTILANQSNAQIIIMGDMNDEPFSPSLVSCLKAKTDAHNLQNNDLFNLMTNKVNKEGTYKFQARWSVIDNIIVSGYLYNGIGNLAIKDNAAIIFKSDFLLMDDEKYLGKKVFRSYNGAHYLGGFSDHLPVYIDLEKINHIEN